MPGLLRGVARTAVVAGTASAVNGRVQRRQAEKFADRDAQTAAERDAAYQEQVASQAPPPPPSPAPAPAATTDVVAQLTALADLKDKGILTEEEFAAQKSKILAG
ncbi:MAG: SHOCT domain-containing protein [Nocardioides sp.]